VTASSITHTISRLSIALATWLGGQIMVTSLDLPIYLGVGLYMIYTVAYFLLLRDEKSRSQRAATTVYGRLDLSHSHNAFTWEVFQLSRKL